MNSRTRDAERSRLAIKIESIRMNLERLAIIWLGGEFEGGVQEMVEQPGQQAPEPTPPTGGPRFSLSSIGGILVQIPNLVKVVGGLIVGLGAIWVFILPILWGPDITVTASCRNDRILVHAENKGGRTGRVGPPRFWIRSARRNNEIDLRRHLVSESEEIDVARTDRGELKYENALDFFGRRESANNGCHIEVTLPVANEDDATGNCLCSYVER